MSRSCEPLDPPALRSRDPMLAAPQEGSLASRMPAPGPAAAPRAGSKEGAGVRNFFRRLGIDRATPSGHLLGVLSATPVGGQYGDPLAATLGGLSILLRTAVLIDGGHLRVLARKAKYTYNPDYIEKVAHACVEPDETLMRILYYDCAPYSGKVKLPVSGADYEFTGSDGWLRVLAAKDLFAVRRGVLKFRGYKPKSIPVATQALTDADFKPDFEQKGVDMRIGLDIANHAAMRSVDRIVLVSGDTDCLPAMKHARISGLQIVLVTFPNHSVAPELLWHSDFERRVAWPAQ